MQSISQIKSNYIESRYANIILQISIQVQDYLKRRHVTKNDNSLQNVIEIESAEIASYDTAIFEEYIRSKNFRISEAEQYYVITFDRF